MKNLISWLMLVLGVVVLEAQVTTIPRVLQKGYSGEVTIIFNPNEGNKGMVGATQCYAHTGITYDGTSWQKTGTWRDGLEKYKMTQNVDGNWELKITPNLFEYYGVSATTEIEQLCFVFNDGPNGNKEGKTATGGDIFVNLAERGLSVVFHSPMGSLFFVDDELNVSASASENADLSLVVNGDTVQQATGTEMEYTYPLTQEGEVEICLVAATAEDTTKACKAVLVAAQSVERLLPDGVELGINYDADASKVVLCTYAAGCKVANDPSTLVPAKAVFVVGDFNDWTLSPDYQMYRDSCHFWLPIEGLEAGKEYAYQYVIIRSDGVEKRVSDGFAHKHLHPDDTKEPQQVDPTLKAYPTQGEGYVSVLQTGQSDYQWSHGTLNFKKPNKNNLIIYELWVYDYTAERSFAGLMKRLDYIQNLGVNAVELMPVSEFEGNYNWGYSPTHYFAVDKAYGSAEQFKMLIDSIHNRGMAVIMDMVFNHSTGLNPQNKLYPYGDDLKYNPWFNVTAPHADNVYEDWNHDFPETHKMFIRCLQYWLKEFKVDGFRMDLSHGFCGKTYNAMTNIVDYYEKGVRAVDTAAYFILEHWGSQMGSERPQLIKQGMLCWNNISNAYSQLARGYFSNDNITSANQQGYVSYCESHDEERNYYMAKSSGVATVKNDETIRLRRVPLTIAFNVLLAGCHLIWQYNELGYDYSINSTRGSNIISTDNRTSTKVRPDELRWFNSAIRMEQYVKVAQIIRLRTQIAPEIFDTVPKSASLGSGNLRSVLWEKGNKRIFAVANFNADNVGQITLPEGGWYDYFTGELVSGESLTLQPGSLFILTSEHYDLPQIETPGLKTLIRKIENESHLSPKKVLKNGHIYIQDGEKSYNLNGKTMGAK